MPREFERIANIFLPLTQGVTEAACLLDDAAFITPKAGETWVVTTDAISEGVHYLSGTSPTLIARRLLRTNLSDLAAKGATPKFYTLNIMLPGVVDDAWIAAFAEGLALDQQLYGIALIGGDSIAVKGEYASFSITAFGMVGAGKSPIKRSGANAGDLVCITGTLGGAAIGLRIAKGEMLPELSLEQQRQYRQRYELPEPRLTFGAFLLHYATSGMDISDGLVQDAGHIARASEKRLVLDISSIPICVPASRNLALTHGDDYELLFTLPPHELEVVTQFAASHHLSVSCIGRVEDGQGVIVLDEKGERLVFEKAGWQH